MKRRYLVTGYSKKDDRMATRVYDDIEHVAELINQMEENIVVKSAKDLDFDV